MAKYHTEGIVKDVMLTQTDGTLTMEATSPFSIDEKSSGTNEASILFVSDEPDPTKERFNQIEYNNAKDADADPMTTTKPVLRDAFLVASKSSFRFLHNRNPIDTASLLILKHNRSKIRVVIEGDRKMTTTPVAEPVFTVFSIIVK